MACVLAKPVNCIVEGVLCMYFRIRADLSNILTEQRVPTVFYPSLEQEGQREGVNLCGNKLIIKGWLSKPHYDDRIQS